MKMISQPRIRTLFILLVLLSISTIMSSRPLTAHAQTGSINWSERINISRSPTMTSVDPFLLGDQAGLVHLFWAEKVFDVPGNVPDTVMYAVWDGRNWSRPVDIHFSPPDHGDQVVAFPHAVIDGNGTIHLIWLAQPNFPNYSIFYSRTHSNLSINPGEWSQAIAIAEDLTGTNYSIDIKDLLSMVGYPDIYRLQGNELPDLISEIGIEYITIAKDMKDRKIPPEDIKKILDIIKPK